MCRASDHYDKCSFTSPDGESCQVEWDGRRRRAVVTRCSNVRRFEFVGSYDKFECGVRIVADVGAVGKWSCYVKEYRNIGPGREVQADINIIFRQIEIHSTSKRTSTQISSTSTKTTENSEDKTEKSRNIHRLLPFTDDSAVGIPVNGDVQQNSILLPVLVSVAVIIILLVTVVSIIWIRRKKVFVSRENSMKMIPLKRENSRMSFRYN